MPILKNDEVRQLGRMTSHIWNGKSQKPCLKPPTSKWWLVGGSIFAICSSAPGAVLGQCSETLGISGLTTPARGHEGPKSRSLMGTILVNGEHGYGSVIYMANLRSDHGKMWKNTQQFSCWPIPDWRLRTKSANAEQRMTKRQKRIPLTIVVPQSHTVS